MSQSLAVDRGRARAVVLAIALASAPLGQTVAQTPTLGRVDFPTSASGPAQEMFVRGVLFMHSFEYDQAASAFRAAQRLDQNFAMAYWGEAMTYTHPVWMQQDLSAARAVLNRLAVTREARHAKAPTEREKRYLSAVETLYGDGGKERRDTLYSRAMEQLSAQYPADDEARSFYALSLLGLQQNGRDIRNYMRAAAMMEEVFARNPLHPGAVHYLIHAYDDPAHAPLGLRAANVYGKVAPSAGHALHMTSHIFVSMGMWDDVISANVAAWNASSRRNGHYTQWLAYGYLQEGRQREALTFVQAMQRAAERDAGTPYNRGYLGRMLGAYLIDTQDWNGSVGRYATDSVANFVTAGEGLLAESVTLDFVAGWTALQRGDASVAGRVLPAMRERVAAAQRAAGGKYVEGLGASDVMTNTLAAALTAHEGRLDQAIEGARTAAEKDESYPFEFGPPETIKPPREYLGELLLTAKRPGEARGAFEAALRKTPNRTRAVLGLARACAALGDREQALAHYARVRGNWAKADGKGAEVLEAETYIDTKR